MTSKFEKTQGMTFSVSSTPITQEDFKSAEFPAAGVNWLDAACATKEISYTGGQKADIDTTTLCSTESEETNGLPTSAEMSLNRNWVGAEEAQQALQAAYDNDEMRVLRIVFPSGNGYYALVEVRQSTWSATTSSVVASTYSLRVKGKLKLIVADAG